MKKWNQPQIKQLGLCKTEDTDKSCVYFGNVWNCPVFQEKAIALLPGDDQATLNNCAYSHGNRCSYNGIIPPSKS